LVFLAGLGTAASLKRFFRKEVPVVFIQAMLFPGKTKNTECDRMVGVLCP
jgi:hypothetical protein